MMAEPMRAHERDDVDLVHDFVVAVMQYVPGSMGWIARQMHNHEWTEDYGFVIGDKFGCVNVVELHQRKDDEQFPREIAAQMLGYEVDSQQDMERRLRAAKVEHIRIEREIRHLKDERDKWAKQIETIEMAILHNGWDIPSFRDLYTRDSVSSSD